MAGAGLVQPLPIGYFWPCSERFRGIPSPNIVAEGTVLPMDEYALDRTWSVMAEFALTLVCGFTHAPIEAPASGRFAVRTTSPISLPPNTWKAAETLGKYIGGAHGCD